MACRYKRLNRTLARPGCAIPEADPMESGGEGAWIAIRRPLLPRAHSMLEPRFRDHNDIAGLHFDIRTHVTLVDQVCKAQIVGLLAITDLPYQF